MSGASSASCWVVVISRLCSLARHAFAALLPLPCLVGYGPCLPFYVDTYCIIGSEPIVAGIGTNHKSLVTMVQPAAGSSTLNRQSIPSIFTSILCIKNQGGSVSLLLSLPNLKLWNMREALKVRTVLRVEARASQRRINKYASRKIRHRKQLKDRRLLYLNLLLHVHFLSILITNTHITSSL
jgi:hypothetical protein